MDLSRISKQILFVIPAKAGIQGWRGSHRRDRLPIWDSLEYSEQFDARLILVICLAKHLSQGASHADSQRSRGQDSFVSSAGAR